MPAVNKATVFLSGKVYWAKVIGAPRPNYGGDAPGVLRILVNKSHYWIPKSIDFTRIKKVRG